MRGFLEKGALFLFNHKYFIKQNIFYLCSMTKTLRSDLV